jgi:hypothetical protein
MNGQHVDACMLCMIFFIPACECMDACGQACTIISMAAWHADACMHVGKHAPSSPCPHCMRMYVCIWASTNHHLHARIACGCMYACGQACTIISMPAWHADACMHASPSLYASMLMTHECTHACIRMYACVAFFRPAC